MLAYVKYCALTIMDISCAGNYKTTQTLWTLWTYEVQLPFSKTSCVQTHLLPKSEIVEMRDLTENIGVKAFSTFLHFEGQA